jgi:hypothetical protein
VRGFIAAKVQVIAKAYAAGAPVTKGKTRGNQNDETGGARNAAVPVSATRSSADKGK